MATVGPGKPAQRNELPPENTQTFSAERITASIFQGSKRCKKLEGFAIAANQQLGKVLLDSPARYARQWVFQVTKYRVRGAPVDLDIRNAVVRF